MGQLQASTGQRASLALLCLCLVLGVWQQIGMFTAEPVFPVDDAYITLQNANELLGQESVFRGAEKLSGATSIAHTLIVAALIFLTSNDLLALSLASMLGAFIYLLGVSELARCYTERLSFVVIITIAGALLADATHQMANGLETSWAMAAVVWSLCLYSRNTETSTKLLGVLLGAQVFVRPELIALSGLLGLLATYRFYTVNPDQELASKFAIRLAGFGLIGAFPFLLANLALTGSAIPNTISAKKVYFAEGCRDLGWKWMTLQESVGWIFKPQWLVVVAMVGLLRNNLGRVLLVFGVVFYAAYFNSFTGALGHYEGRYQYLLLPIILLGLLLCLDWLKGLAQPHADSFGAAVILIAAVVFTAPAGLQLAEERRAFTSDHLKPIAAWLNDNISEDQHVLIHDVGYVGYAIDKPVLEDLVGLKTPSNIKYHEQITWPSCGAERYLAIGSIFLESKPDIVVVYDVWDMIFRITPSYMAVGAELKPLLRTGQGGYSIYKVSYTEPSS